MWSRIFSSTYRGDLHVIFFDAGHFSHLNHMNDCTVIFCLTSLYSYREFWHLAAYADKYPYRIGADVRSLIIFVWKFINGYCCCCLVGNCVLHAKTCRKLINTTFIIGGNLKTKKGSLTVTSMAYYYPLHHITPPLTCRALLELMQTTYIFFWLPPIHCNRMSVKLACVSGCDYTRKKGGFCAVCFCNIPMNQIIS
jgi:hypothetical protein